MRKGVYVAAVAWFVTAATTTFSNGQEDSDPVKTLIQLGADVRYDLPFKSVYRSYLDEQFVPIEEKVLRVWIDPTWNGGKAGLEYLSKLSDLQGVSFQSGTEQSDWYRILTRLPRLRQFCSIGESVDDECCGYLSSCKDLDTLSVVGSSITLAGMKKLKGLDKLEWVSLKSATNFGNAGLAHLPVKNLIYLNLEGTGVTGDGIATLSDATQLQYLRLSGDLFIETDNGEGKPGEAGLKHLRKLTNLKRLQVGSMVVNEADMIEILRQSKQLPWIESDNGVYTRKGWETGPDLEAESMKRLEELVRKLQKPNTGSATLLPPGQSVDLLVAEAGAAGGRGCYHRIARAGIGVPRRLTIGVCRRRKH
jgi:hypothetical protein